MQFQKLLQKLEMLHEIFLSLVGFTGNLIAESPDCFSVKDGVDILTIAEKEQINTIVILGWYYNKICAFVKMYELQWGSVSNFQAYKHALCLGLSDLVREYVDDISFLEQLASHEGPIPLSHVNHHVQKV